MTDGRVCSSGVQGQMISEPGLVGGKWFGEGTNLRLCAKLCLSGMP